MDTQLLDLGVVCLVCLREEPGYCSIYGQDLETPDMLIVDKIRNCSALQLEQSLLGRLPDKICHGCRNELSITYRFQQKCQEAHKVFQKLAASSATQLVEVDELAKLELAQHQVKLPANLNIKRVDNVSASATNSLLLTQTAAPKVEYYNEETDMLTLIPDATDGDRTLVTLQDVAVSSLTTLSLDSIDVPTKDDSSDNHDERDSEDEKMLVLPASWRPQLETLLPQTEDVKQSNDEQQQQVLYEIEAELLEDSDGALEFKELSKSCADSPTTNSAPIITNAAAPAPVPAQTSIVLAKRRRYNRMSPIRGRRCEAHTDDDNEPVNSPMTRRSARRTRGNITTVAITTAAFSEPLNSSINSANDSSRNRRGTERPLKICDICGNTYKYQHALNAHMRRHNNERPFCCEVCQKAFISNVELRRHMRVHTGQKPYGCSYCDRRFSDFGSSKKHERIHTGERPYVCDVCKKGFAYAHVLSVHKRTHTGKKQFQCTLCEKGFTKKIYLITHMSQHRISHKGKRSEANTTTIVTTAASTMTTTTTTHKYDRHLEALEDADDEGVVQYEDEEDEEADADDDEDDNVSVGISVGGLRAINVSAAVANGIVEEAKVLEECIVTNDFMFNEVDEEDEDEGELNDDEYQDVELEQHIVSDNKGPYDLLDADDLEVESKYIID
ncbi:zinc finger protein 394 [Scaptodrosophila lebanonensis]|uniref:Zinc finger protein 394 n=1 Tax=Drosophila lebanonensis TaxID=7225 RepID=A0A6J2TSD0_DROLE|nr:zinc finger protein 394 [Scaptodrosophila lebanonensis]